MNGNWHPGGRSAKERIEVASTWSKHSLLTPMKSTTAGGTNSPGVNSRPG